MGSCMKPLPKRILLVVFCFILISTCHYLFYPFFSRSISWVYTEELYDICPCHKTLSPTPVTFNGDSYSYTQTSKIPLVSSCSARADARGSKQWVVSYSLFGEFLGPYYPGMIKNVAHVKEMYPEWILRLYMDLSDNRTRTWACSLACSNPHVDLCDVTDIPGLGDVSYASGDLWRFLVVGDPLLERYVVRDADSFITQREVDAVDEWIRSGKCFHVMRDHPFHSSVMLAGMWGGCNNWNLAAMQIIRLKLIKFTTAIRKDQPALKKHLWPEVIKNSLMHDSYHCKRFKGSKPFPTRRQNFTFVAMSTYRKNMSLDKPCPVECRPPDHQDWVTC